MATNGTASCPLLSVTVLNYNYAQYLGPCLDSILAQTYGNFEVIVIDDASTDNSRDVIDKYRHDPRVRVVAHKENKGFVASLIEGTELLSRGDFLTVISADDAVIQPHAFERQMSAMVKNMNVSWCFSAFERYDSDISKVIEITRAFPEDVIIHGTRALRLCMADTDVQVLHSGTVFRRDVYERAGGYRRDLRGVVDYALWPLLCLEGDVAYCSEPLYRYRIHSKQMTQKTSVARKDAVDVISAIRVACERAEQRGWNVGSLQRDAIRCMIFAAALDDAWSRRPLAALARCWIAVTLRPREAITSRFLWIVLARLALGERFVDLAWRMNRRLASSMQRPRVAMPPPVCQEAKNSEAT